MVTLDQMLFHVVRCIKKDGVDWSADAVSTYIKEFVLDDRAHRREEHEANLKAAKESYDRAVAERDNIQIRVNNVINEKDKIKLELVRCIEVCETALNQRDALIVDRDTIRDSLNRVKEEHRQFRDAIQKRHQELLQKCNEFITANEEMKQAVARVGNQLAEDREKHAKEIEGMRTNAEERLDECERHCIAITEQRDQLQQTLNRTESKLEHFVALHKANEKERTELLVKYQHLEQMRQSAEQERDGALSRNQDLSNAIDRVQSELEDLATRWKAEERAKNESVAANRALFDDRQRYINALAEEKTRSEHYMKACSDAQNLLVIERSKRQHANSTIEYLASMLNSKK